MALTPPPSVSPTPFSFVRPLSVSRLVDLSSGDELSRVAQLRDQGVAFLTRHRPVPAEGSPLSQRSLSLLDKCAGRLVGWWRGNRVGLDPVGKALGSGRGEIVHPPTDRVVDAESRLDAGRVVHRRSGVGVREPNLGGPVEVRHVAVEVRPGRVPLSQGCDLEMGRVGAASFQQFKGTVRVDLGLVVTASQNATWLAVQFISAPTGNGAYHGRKPTKLFEARR